jgi:hypothetical protein
MLNMRLIPQLAQARPIATQADDRGGRNVPDREPETDRIAY